MTTQNTALTPFEFKTHKLRVEADDQGNPWFVAADVSEILGYRSSSDMTRRLDDDERDTRKVRTLGGLQEMNVISESGLYASIIGSNKPEAKPFRKWITSEVLPSIRKTGQYSKELPNALKGLPEPPSISKAQSGELCALVANKSKSSGKPIAYYWSRFNNHWKLASYKNLPAERFEDAMSYLSRLEGDNDPMYTLTKAELDQKISDHIKSFPPVIQHLMRQRLLLRFREDGSYVAESVPDDAYVLTDAQYENLLAQRGLSIVPTEAVKAIAKVLNEE